MIAVLPENIHFISTLCNWSHPQIPTYFLYLIQRKKRFETYHIFFAAEFTSSGKENLFPPSIFLLIGT